MEFNDWLVESGYATDTSNIEFELSADEVYILYNIWAEESGDTYICW